jgi:hypothetical protein
MTDELFFSKLVTKSLHPVHGSDRFFEGYLTVEVKDKQGEITIVDELIKVLPIWMDRGAPITDTHSNRVIGKGINYQQTVYKAVDGEEYPAIKIIGKIHNDYELDNEIWKRITSGEYKGLSFGGATKSSRTPFRMKDGSLAYQLKDLEHYEVAVCKDPAVPLALITDYNPVAKALTDNYTMHSEGKMLIRCSNFGCMVEKSHGDAFDNGEKARAVIEREHELKGEKPDEDEKKIHEKVIEEKEEEGRDKDVGSDVDEGKVTKDADHSTRLHGTRGLGSDPEAQHKESEQVTVQEEDKEDKNKACWEDYRQDGFKKIGDRTVPNCVKKAEYQGELLNKEVKDGVFQGNISNAQFAGNNKEESFQKGERKRQYMNTDDAVKLIAEPANESYVARRAEELKQPNANAKMTNITVDPEGKIRHIDGRHELHAMHRAGVKTVPIQVREDSRREDPERLSNIDLNDPNLIGEEKWRKKAEYQGEEVELNKPMRDDGDKKFKVYVEDPSSGKVVIVRFGDPNMEIKRDDPERRASFRARHDCDNAKDITTPQYWSCKMWEKESTVTENTNKADDKKEHVDLSDHEKYPTFQSKVDAIVANQGISEESAKKIVGSKMKSHKKAIDSYKNATNFINTLIKDLNNNMVEESESKHESASHEEEEKKEDKEESKEKVEKSFQEAIKSNFEAVTEVIQSLAETQKSVQATLKSVDDRLKALETPTDLPLKPATTDSEDIGADVKVPAEPYVSNSEQAELDADGAEHGKDQSSLSMQEKHFTTETPRPSASVNPINKSAKDFNLVLKDARESGDLSAVARDILAGKYTPDLKSEDWY